MESITSLYVPMVEGTIDGWGHKGFDTAVILTQRIEIVAWYSQTWNWFNGAWHEGNPPLIGPRSHVSWLGSSVFAGASIFEGVAPDLDRHCERVNRSAPTIGLKPTMDAQTMLDLVREGVKKFAPGTALYVKPMYWGEAEGLA